MSALNDLKGLHDLEIRSALSRLVTNYMARDDDYSSVVQSRDDMKLVARTMLGREVDLDRFAANDVDGANAMRCVAHDIARLPVLQDALIDSLAAGEDTLIDADTDSVFLAVVVLIGWEMVRVGYSNPDLRLGLRAQVADRLAIERRFLILRAILNR